MSEQSPSMHEVVEQDLAELSGNVHISEDPQFSRATQTADLEGNRLGVDIQRTEKVIEQSHTSARASKRPVDELLVGPEPIPGNDRYIGIHQSHADLSRTVQRDGSVGSRATVDLLPGTYIAREYRDAPTDTRVKRPGYGVVEIRNPRARTLVASLAGKAIKKSQTEIQDVKGKELVQDREWLKKARRAARRATGKKTAA